MKVTHRQMTLLQQECTKLMRSQPTPLCLPSLSFPYLVQREKDKEVWTIVVVQWQSRTINYFSGPVWRHGNKRTTHMALSGKKFWVIPHEILIHILKNSSCLFSKQPLCQNINLGGNSLAFCSLGNQVNVSGHVYIFDHTFLCAFCHASLVCMLALSHRPELASAKQHPDPLLG